MEWGSGESTKGEAGYGRKVLHLEAPLSKACSLYKSREQTVNRAHLCTHALGQPHLQHALWLDSVKLAHAPTAVIPFDRLRFIV